MVSRFISDLVGRRLLRRRLDRGLAALRETVEHEMSDGTLAIPKPNDGIESEIEAAILSSFDSDSDE